MPGMVVSYEQACGVKIVVAACGVEMRVGVEMVVGRVSGATLGQAPLMGQFILFTDCNLRLSVWIPLLFRFQYGFDQFFLDHGWQQIVQMTQLHPL